MKILLALSIITLSLSVSAADVALITLKKGSGFSPRPQSYQLTISETGAITKTSQSTSGTTKESLGKLSAKAILSIKDKIETISDDAKPVDPNPKAPKCMDAPSTSININKGGKEIVIFKRVACHTSVVNEGEANTLVELMTALQSL